MSLRCGENYQIQNRYELTSSSNNGVQNTNNESVWLKINLTNTTVEHVEHATVENEVDQSAAIDTAIRNLNLNSAARKALEPKAKAIVLFAQNNNLVLEQDELVTRLENFAKGIQLNKKLNDTYEEVYYKGAQGKVIIDYNAPEGANKEEKLEALKAHYQDLAASYIANFDSNNNGKIEVNEVYTRELGDYYKAQGKSVQEAFVLTQQVIKNLDLEAIGQRIANGEELTDEEGLFLITLERFEVLNKDPDGEMELTNTEVQRYFAAASQYNGDCTPSMTDDEYFKFENDIYDNPENIKTWLTGAGSFLGI